MISSPAIVQKGGYSPASRLVCVCGDKTSHASGNQNSKPSANEAVTRLKALKLDRISKLSKFQIQFVLYSDALHAPNCGRF